VLVARAVGSYQWVPFQLLAQGTVQATRPFAVDGWLAPIIREIYATVNIVSSRLGSVFARRTRQGGPRFSAAVPPSKITSRWYLWDLIWGDFAGHDGRIVCQGLTISKFL
jgi:hypothetical protein